MKKLRDKSLFVTGGGEVGKVLGGFGGSHGIEEQRRISSR